METVEIIDYIKTLLLTIEELEKELQEYRIRLDHKERFNRYLFVCLIAYMLVMTLFVILVMFKLS